jgi:SAM-dependent methyltransferase
MIKKKSRTEFAQTNAFFDASYFENGKVSKKSLYENYRWLPDETGKLAEALINFTGIKKNQTLLDFGCARGYVVRAMTERGIDAYGCDVSNYAIKNCDKSIKDRVVQLTKKISKDNINGTLALDYFDYIIAKDVFEHIPEDQLLLLLSGLREVSNKLYVLTPLGDNGVYRIPEYELDASHVIAESEIWWQSIFRDAGFEIESFHFAVPGIKELAMKSHPKGNGHFKLIRRD